MLKPITPTSTLLELFNMYRYESCFKGESVIDSYIRARKSYCWRQGIVPMIYIYR